MYLALFGLFFFFLWAAWFADLAITEPLWFLHHAQIDRLYWLWQQQNPRSQLPSFDPFGNFTREETLPDVTGDELMDTGALSEKMMVKDMFDIRSDYVCYGYK